MTRNSNSQPIGECPLTMFLETLDMSPEELAGVITYLSGQKISGATLRRREDEGKEGWRKLSMTGPQWLAFCKVLGVPSARLHELIEQPELFIRTEN